MEIGLMTNQTTEQMQQKVMRLILLWMVLLILAGMTYLVIHDKMFLILRLREWGGYSEGDLRRVFDGEMKRLEREKENQHG
jgi:hypothetical protein